MGHCVCVCLLWFRFGDHNDTSAISNDCHLNILATFLWISPCGRVSFFGRGGNCYRNCIHEGIATLVAWFSFNIC